MYEKELKVMMEAALKAEEWILSVRAEGFSIEIKSDDSPVTKADKGADELIRKTIHEAFPDFGFLTEESRDDLGRLNKRDVIIVDPLDGTKGFVEGKDDFATLIALCHNHKIVVGVVNIPAQHRMYYAVRGHGAYRILPGKAPERIHVNDKSDGLRVLISRHFHNAKEDEAIKRHKAKFASVESMGAALKFCAIAEGEAELSYRYSGGTKEWDTAAPSIVLEEAGGIMRKPDGTEYRYNREDVYNRDGYLIANREENLLF